QLYLTGTWKLLFLLRVATGYIIDVEPLAVDRDSKVILSPVVLQKDLAQPIGIRISQALMQIAQRDRHAMQFRPTRLALQADIQLFNVFDLGEIVQPQGDTTQSTARTGFERHHRCGHEPGELADA